MAWVLRLRPAVQGMDRILNVDARVGPYSDCPNYAADVEALQRLLSLLPATRRISPPSPSGVYDAATGFYIYYAQVESKKNNPGAVVDGVVSPAFASASYGTALWLIVRLNYWARQLNRAGWETLLARYPEMRHGRVDVLLGPR